MLKNLIAIANKLDQRGLTKEADELDSIIRSYAAWDPEQAKRHYDNRFNTIFEKLKKTFKVRFDVKNATHINLYIKNKIKQLQGSGIDVLSFSISDQGEKTCGLKGYKVFCRQDVIKHFKTSNQIASVLAHEMAHFILHHEMPDEEGKNEMMETKMKKRMKPGSDLDKMMQGAKLVSKDPGLEYQAQETDADRLGCLLAEAAGFRCDLEFVKRLEGEGLKYLSSLSEKERVKAEKEAEEGDYVPTDLRQQNIQVFRGKTPTQPKK